MRLSTTQVVKADHAITAAIIVVWVLSGALWLASWFGSYIPFAAGPAGALSGPAGWPGWDGTAALWSTVFQVLVSVVQWGAWAMYRRDRSVGWLIAGVLTLLLSGVPSFLTYWGWAGADLTAICGGEAWSPFVAGVVLGLAVLAGDRVPEKVFLKA